MTEDLFAKFDTVVRDFGLWLESPGFERLGRKAEASSCSTQTVGIGFTTMSLYRYVSSKEGFSS